MEGQRLTLLLVSDDEIGATAIKRALRDGLDAELDEEHDPAGIVGRLGVRAYDCLILDDPMAEEDAVTLIRGLRALGVTLPILVVTSQPEDVGAELAAAGASDYLPKAELSPTRLARRLRFAIRVCRAEERTSAALAQLAAERQLLEAVLKQMPAAVMIADAATGEVLLANEQVRELLGQPVVRKDTIAQLRRYAAYKADGSALAPDEWPLARALTRCETVVNEELTCERADGTRVLLRASASPVWASEHGGGAAERALAAVMTLDDLTDERRAQAQLSRAVRAREDILAIVSHDLRNPLNAVSVAVEELVDPSLENAARERYVGAIRRSVKRADRLIRDLLDASRIEAGKLAVECSPQSVRPLLEQARHDHEVLAKDAGMTVELSIDGDPRVLADRERTLQALGNLIGNALRYARGGGIVELSAHARERRIELCVADRGPGVPPDALPHIFDRWQARQQRRAGAGLGLAIALGIAEAHGGVLRAENRPDGGAKFVLCLPAA